MSENKIPQQADEFDKRTTRLLQLLIALLLFGRAWQGLFWDLPLRTFFWDQLLLEAVVTMLTNDTWHNYVTNKSLPTDQLIDGLGVGLGIFWALSAFSLFFLKYRPRLGKWLLYINALTLFVLACLYFKEGYWQVGQLLEYSMQVGAPVIFAYVLYANRNTKRFRTTVKLIIALTFFSHGLYAIGYYPRPGSWVEWSRHIFGFKGDDSIRYFLIGAGVLDILASLALFLPWRWVYRSALGYCIFWGFLTAFARLAGNFYLDMAFASLHQSWYEVAYRLVHGGLPLLLWYWMGQAERAKN